ncbi:Uncharacterised protein [Mycobacteroides abscessus subsp. bolletii]|nr:Uncharacterised protein [Mycobacteroides abscessus subsp. bolletii]
MDLVGGQRRGIALQLGQSLAEGLGKGRRDGGLENGKGLPEFHGRALELAENLEQLFGRLLHHLGVDFVLGLAGQTFSDAQRGSTGDACR